MPKPTPFLLSQSVDHLHSLRWNNRQPMPISLPPLLLILPVGLFFALILVMILVLAPILVPVLNKTVLASLRVLPPAVQILVGWVDGLDSVNKLPQEHLTGGKIKGCFVEKVDDGVTADAGFPDDALSPTSEVLVARSIQEAASLGRAPGVSCALGDVVSQAVAPVAFGAVLQLGLKHFRPELLQRFLPGPRDVLARGLPLVVVGGEDRSGCRELVVQLAQRGLGRAHVCF